MLNFHQTKVKAFLAFLMLSAVTLSTFTAKQAFATNGMLFDGYGPISQAMGGASMAYDNGTAAMSNNPATLGLMPDGNRVDIALGFLMPDVRYETPGKTYKSSSDLFLMPAIGYVRKDGDFAYGIGMYSLGGMGTDYLDDNLGMYSQVIVGKILVPFAYDVTDKFTIGATISLTQAQMDIVLKPRGPMMPKFDFKDGSDFSGATSDYGVSGKLGFTYKLHDRFTIGGAYHNKGGIGDLTGKGARVEGFDMPATANIGFAANITDDLMFTADYQKIFWSEVMQTITITQGNQKAELRQDWRDQNVVSMGLAYTLPSLPELTLRAGVNLGDNPVNKNATPMFPAIIENHYTAGFGYKFNETHSVNASFSYAPKVRVNNDGMFRGTSTTHEQTSSQIMYSINF
ncbi:OmpP1/FadL family transporter [Desulfovibrio litoralis]|uniref:Long-chain fatty acid transport protein n=1 Tax=Desulfovibrio litoralis DSM 11393 TaxID=1121455 RepID=A0A1M7SCQ6_9BACT|nr:outer membrane protein transport protein [Desulfovibrio litoralis]SHN56270.1 long-chain fatty acid transport protein [Desulfovibrio litoralis DSM 11393]